MPLLQMEADVAGGVAGRPDGPQPPSGEVQQLAGDDLAVGEGGAQSGQGPQSAAARAARSGARWSSGAPTAASLRVR